MAQPLPPRLSEVEYLVEPSDLKVKVESRTRYHYPDASVVCGGPRFVDGKRDAILNPSVVVEVLSDSTEKDDRGRKFLDYQQIPDLIDYLLCSSNEPLVEHYSRELDGSWRLRVCRSGELVKIPSIDVAVSVDQLYADVFVAT